METTSYEGVCVGQPSGALIGNLAADKIGFHGITPCIQASAITSPGTTASTSTTPYGYASSAQATAVVVAVDAIITALKDKGILAGGTAVTLR